MNKVNIKNKFELFDAYWTPKILEPISVEPSCRF